VDSEVEQENDPDEGLEEEQENVDLTKQVVNIPSGSEDDSEGVAIDDLMELAGLRVSLDLTADFV
jgi:hypothetical protein